jgi:hypothetical protein
LKRPEEILKVLAQDDSPPTYHELSTFTREEWDAFRADSARQQQVGEGRDSANEVDSGIAENTLERRRKRLAAKSKRSRKPTRDWEELQSLSSEEKSDRESSEENVPQEALNGPRDADAHERTLFDGPLAVVV